jgi:4-carboxymuconolactone decarboxylase
MKQLNKKEKELVALGASIACNCIPCIVYHVEQAKKTGITVEQIKDAIELAKKIKEVPAELVINTAMAHLDRQPEMEIEDADQKKTDCSC